MYSSCRYCHFAKERKQGYFCLIWKEKRTLFDSCFYYNNSRFPYNPFIKLTGRDLQLYIIQDIPDYIMRQETPDTFDKFIAFHKSKLQPLEF